MNARLLSLLVALMALAMAVPGCGSDSDGDSNGAQSGGATTAQEKGRQSGQGQVDETESGSETATDGSASPEKAAFVKKASTACTKARESAFEKLQASGSGESSIEAALLIAIQAEIAAIGSLPAPAEDEGEINEIVGDMQATLDKAQAMKGASYSEIEELFGDTDAKLEAYGLTACSKSV